MGVSNYVWYWMLAVTQAGLVFVPRVPRSRVLTALRPRWALIALPLGAATAATFLPAVAAKLAGDLSTLALLAVPILAVVASIWIFRRRRWWLIIAGNALLLALAWIDPGRAVGDLAAIVLVALSAVAVAMIVVAVVPMTAVKIGIGAWALLDLSLALDHRLVEASRPITEATPTLGTNLQFQRVELGSASMEWADLFVAAALGAVLVAEGRRRGPAALLVALLAVSFSAFFLVTDVLPGTVPVALALLAETVRPGTPRRPVSSRPSPRLGSREQQRECDQ